MKVFSALTLAAIVATVSAPTFAQLIEVTPVSHDIATIRQQNNSQLNEALQTLMELRRQQVAQFEARMMQIYAMQAQDNQLFANTMEAMLAARDAQNARRMR